MGQIEAHRYIQKVKYPIPVSIHGAQRIFAGLSTIRDAIAVGIEVKEVGDPAAIYVAAPFQ